MRYALTGATGFVGGVLATQLRAAGHEVVALVRDPARAGSLTAQGVELVPGDLDDTAALDRLCAGVDGLFHVAGWYQVGVADAAPGERVNVAGTRNVLQAARRANVPKIVYTSTLAVNSDTEGQVVDESYRFTGDHLSHYDRTKAKAHDIAEAMAAEGLPVVIVQPGLVYGPGDTAKTGRMLAKVVRGSRPSAPKVGGVCWAHVDDVAAGHVLAMEKGTVGQSYFLAGERATLAEGLQRAAEIAGTKGPYAVPESVIRLGTLLTQGSFGPFFAEAAFETLRAAKATYWGDASKAKRELGWQPRSLDDGLRQTVAALRA